MRQSIMVAGLMLMSSLVFGQKRVDVDPSYSVNNYKHANKATYAKKHMILVPLKGRTIPHMILIKKGAARVLLKPAPIGTGVIAGGAVRNVVTAAGIENISSKVLGTKNQASNVYATIEALRILAERLITSYS